MVYRSMGEVTFASAVVADTSTDQPAARQALQRPRARCLRLSRVIRRCRNGFSESSDDELVPSREEPTGNRVLGREIAANFLRAKLEAQSPNDLQNYVQALKIGSLVDLVGDLAHRVRYEVLRYAQDEGTRRVRPDLLKRKRLEVALRALEAEVSCMAEISARENPNVEELVSVKAQSRGLLWQLREQLDSLNPSESVRLSLEEVRAALLDKSGEAACVQNAGKEPTDTAAAKAGLHTLVRFIFEDSMLMMELQSLRLLQRDINKTVEQHGPEESVANLEIREALRALDLAGAQLSLDEHRVRGKRRLMEALEVVETKVCGERSCSLSVARVLATLRNAIQDAVESDRLDRGPHGQSMLLRPRIQDIPNFEKVVPTLLRGGQPTERGIKWLKDYGCKAVVDLRGSDRNNQWVSSSTWGSMKVYNIAIEDFEAPTLDQVQTFVNLASDPGNLPLYVHCKAGIGRTGTLIALWRVVCQGLDVNESLKREQLYSADGGGLRQERFVRDAAVHFETLGSPKRSKKN